MEMSGDCSTAIRIDRLLAFRFIQEKSFSVDLVNDSLYEWNVTLHQIDDESLLFENLQKMKKLGRSGEILLNVTFDSNYPFAPPFVRVVEPKISSWQNIFIKP
jgi:ubiquitin-conjugating enzyme E2 Q